MHRVSSYEGKKVPQCAWSNGLLLGQCICMYEIFPCSCYHIILASEQVLQSAGACLLIFFTEGWHVESSLQISVKVLLKNTWNILKGFIFVKSLYLWCFSLLSGHVISGQWSIGLAHFRYISLSTLIICSGWGQNMLFRYTPCINHQCFWFNSLYLGRMKQVKGKKELNQSGVLKLKH